MPLKSGSSEQTISRNIATELRDHPNMQQKQAAAIAYNKARGDAKQRGDALTPSRTLANNIQEFLLAIKHCGERADLLKLRFDSMMAEDCK